QNAQQDGTRNYGEERFNQGASPCSCRSTCDCRLWTTNRRDQRRAQTIRAPAITCRLDSLPLWYQRCEPSDRATGAWRSAYYGPILLMNACPFRISRARDYFQARWHALSDNHHWFEIEQDPRALIYAARNPFESDGDLAIVKIVHVLGHDIGEVSVGLHTVEKFGVALA